MVEKLLRKHGTKLFLGYMVGAVVSLVVYETEFDQAFLLAFEFPTVPIFVAASALFWFGLPGWKEEVDILKGGLLTLLAAALITRWSGAYLVGLNAWGGRQTEVRVQGEVTRKWISHGRRGRVESHHVTVRDPGTGEITRLRVDESVYERYEEGQRYDERWRIGSLGLIDVPVTDRRRGELGTLVRPRSPPAGTRRSGRRAAPPPPGRSPDPRTRPLPRGRTGRR